MDGLIVLLIIIGVISSISKSNKKKKKAAEAQRKAEKPSSAQSKPDAAKIPYTREEWAAFLKEEGVPEAVVQPKPATAKAAAPAPKKRRAKAVHVSGSWLPSMCPMPGFVCGNGRKAVQSVNQAAAGQLKVANFVISTVSSVPAAIFVV